MQTVAIYTYADGTTNTKWFPFEMLLSEIKAKIELDYKQNPFETVVICQEIKFASSFENKLEWE